MAGTEARRVRPGESSRASEETVFRPREAKVFPQGRLLVFAAEQAAALQFRHQPVDGPPGTDEKPRTGLERPTTPFSLI